MWEYNRTENMYSANRNSENELYHYGVLGMRWGHRKSQSVMDARAAYKAANKELRTAKRKKIFSASSYVAGHNNVIKAKKLSNNIKNATNKRNSAAFKLTDAQAKYAYDKKLAKTGNKDKAIKAEMRVYKRSMAKGVGGLPGSYSDSANGKIGTKYYNHLAKTKGKKYAQAVEKKYKNQLMTTLAASSIALGASIYAQYKYM